MADSIHVFELPDNTRENQLKVYFGNPENGGGRIKQILHPLPCNSAIVVFENPDTIHNIMKYYHVFKGKKLPIYPLPKQVFGRTTVELEQECSQFLKKNDQVVDELQYLGELKVEFLSDKKIFVLEGNWYKLQWALHYLDNVLTKSGFGNPEHVHDKEQARDEQWQGYEEIEQADHNFEPTRHEIEKLNIPMIRKSPPTTDKRQQIYNRTSKKIPLDKATERAIMREGASTNKSEFDAYKSANSAERYERETRDGTKAGRNVYQKKSVDSDNVEESYRAYSTREYSPTSLAPRSVFFSEDTDFTEDKLRPRRMNPRRTKGIGMAQTDFGQAPLTYEINLPNSVTVNVAMDDITKQSTDGIVNPTSPDLSSTFGASRAIIQACGYEMQVELEQYLIDNGTLSWAEVFHTSAGGRLNKSVTHVLHTASPQWRADDSDIAAHRLVCTYINCLVYADSKLWLQSISTPVISSGAFGFPLDDCIQAFYDAVLLFATNSAAPNHLRTINLICYDESTTVATIMILQSLFDCDLEQAMQAAVDRYRTRYVMSNFAAGNFDIDGNLSLAKREQSTQPLQPAKLKKNKNAVMRKVEQREDSKTCTVKQEEASGPRALRLIDHDIVDKSDKKAYDNQAEMKTDSAENNQKTPPTQAVKEQIIAIKEVSESINSLKHKDESSEENKDNKDKDSKNEDHGVPVKEFIGADSNTSGIDNLEEQFNEISDDDNDVSAGDLQAKISDTEDLEDVKTGEQLYDEEYVEEKVDDGNLAKSGAQALKVSANDDYEAFETLQD